MGFSQAPGLPYGKLGIPEDGDTASRAISKGKYVIWKGKNYFAKTDILQGETFVENTNLTEIPDGALNGIANALSASSIYSTEEQVAGKWIDGSVLYKKTFNVSCTIMENADLLGMQALPSGYKVVKIESCLYCPHNTDPAYIPLGRSLSIILLATNMRLYATQTYTAQSYVWTGTVTLYYTK